MFVAAAALVVAGLWAGVELHGRAETAERRISLFASERISTEGNVVRLRKRGGDDGYRTTAHYRYTAQGRELTGATTLRRNENDRYAVGSPIKIWYLATEPETSWVDGYGPRPFASWPAAAVPFACAVAALTLIQLVRRQSSLLAYGRPAMATITKVENKKSDYGAVWMVYYEWTTLSGAPRTGKYQHGKKEAPIAGQLIPIVYDRDEPSRHGKYPMGLVKVESRK